MITYRPAKRENVPLLVGFAGATGPGKTLSALRFARGLAGPEGKIAFIDTEAGRALHYADAFEFMHFPMRAPFEPGAYRRLIAEVDEAGIFDVIVVDSMSHEHAGDGGILDMHEAELDRIAGDDWKKRERVKMLAWARPKGEHRKMVTRLLQCRAHLVLCFRAEEKALVGKDERGNQKIVAAADRPLVERWVPTCASGLMYELTTSLLLLPDRPGVPVPVKLQEQHRFAFPQAETVSEETGRLMGEWARGGAPRQPAGIPEEEAEELERAAREAASADGYREFWEKLAGAERAHLKRTGLHDELKAQAGAA